MSEQEKSKLSALINLENCFLSRCLEERRNSHPNFQDAIISTMQVFASKDLGTYWKQCNKIAMAEGFTSLKVSAELDDYFELDLNEWPNSRIQIDLPEPLTEAFKNVVNRRFVWFPEIITEHAVYTFEAI